MLVAWPALKEAKKMVKRTPKFFQDYNDYHDRGMMKWATAYAMDELVKSIAKSTAEATKSSPTLPAMTAEEISNVLQEAFETKKPVSVQLHLKDKFGRQTDSILGNFNGDRYYDEILIGDEWLFYDDIRNVFIIHDEKWFKIEMFEQSKKKALQEKLHIKRDPFEDARSEVIPIQSTEIDWIDDFNQDQEDTWFDEE